MSVHAPQRLSSPVEEKDRDTEDTLEVPEVEFVPPEHDAEDEETLETWLPGDDGEVRRPSDGADTVPISRDEHPKHDRDSYVGERRPHTKW